MNFRKTKKALLIAGCVVPGWGMVCGDELGSGKYRKPIERRARLMGEELPDGSVGGYTCPHCGKGCNIQGSGHGPGFCVDSKCDGVMTFACNRTAHHEGELCRFPALEEKIREGVLEATRGTDERLQRMEKALRTLQGWKWLELDSDLRGVSLDQAPWAQLLIKEALDG